MQEQTGALLGQVAGFVGVKTVEMGLQHGLIAELAGHPNGISSRDLAKQLQLDPFYTGVWLQAANASGVVNDVGDELYQLAEHLETLLLGSSSPAYIGAMFTLVNQPEMFDGFSADLGSGDGTWWDELSPEFIDNVIGTGAPFNARLIPGGLDRVPGLSEFLKPECRILELACGAGTGLARLAEHYPQATIVGTDGDAHSLDLARKRLARLGLEDRVQLMESPMETLEVDEPFDLITINISMHECRDIDEVARRVLALLRPGGFFVNSDFAFPETEDGLRTVPGRIMSGIQYFEARIGDQLVSVPYYMDLLNRMGFEQVESFDITPIHSVTHGRRPR